MHQYFFYRQGVVISTLFSVGFRSILRASFKGHDRDLNHIAPFFPMYKTDVGMCSLVVPMVAFEDQFKMDNLEQLTKERTPMVEKGASLGKDAGLRLLIDAEVSLLALKSLLKYA